MQDARSGFLIPAAASATDPAALQFSQRPPAAVDACLRAIERVEQIVDQETYALQHRKRGGLDDFNRRKSHGLLDLTRAIRALGGAAAGHSLQPRLRALQAKLK